MQNCLAYSKFVHSTYCLIQNLVNDHDNIEMNGVIYFKQNFSSRDIEDHDQATLPKRKEKKNRLSNDLSSRERCITNATFNRGGTDNWA
jgi:hypothetical protein